MHGKRSCSAAGCAAPARARQGAARHREEGPPQPFRWNGKVNGKRLGRGTYLLTYRSLKGTRITNTSGSIRFKIAKGGKLRQVRAEPRTPGGVPCGPWREMSTSWARSTSTSW